MRSHLIAHSLKQQCPYRLPQVGLWQRVAYPTSGSMHGQEMTALEQSQIQMLQTDALARLL